VDGVYKRTVCTSNSDTNEHVVSKKFRRFPRFFQGAKDHASCLVGMGDIHGANGTRNME
jgi:hypothetical protein